MKKLILKIAISSIICLSLGAGSGISIVDDIKNWYPFILKPDWNPPNWIFGPVWTLLYLMMGISVGLVWHNSKQNKNKALGLFILQFILNMAWSAIFFNHHLIGWAFVEIMLMLLAILFTIISFYKIEKLAAYLLIPYLCWVSFASVLNGTVWYLNY